MSKKNSNHIKSKNKNNTKHYKKGYKKIAFFVVLFLILVLIINLKNNKTNIKNDKTQIIYNNENISLDLKKDIINENDNIYLSFEDIANVLDKTIYQEDTTGLIITTSAKKLATLKVDEENININGSNIQLKNPVIEKDGTIYLAISELENVYDYNLNYNQDTNVVVIESLNKKCVKAYTKKTAKIKAENKMFSKVLEKVKKGQWLIYISEENGIAKVRTQSGNIGYVKLNKLDNFVTERENFIEEKSDLTQENVLEYDITKKDISTFEKRENIINLILQEAIKNDKIYAKIVYTGESNLGFERFKIEVVPILKECGITAQV